MADIVIVYYSRTGKTRMVAEKLGATLGADVEEIREAKSRGGVAGFWGGVKDALFKRKAELASEHTAEGRKAVVLGMPVWAASPPPAIRQYVQAVDLKGKKLFAFCTMDSSGGKGTLSKLAEMAGDELLETLELKKPDKDSRLDEKLNDFANRIKTAMC